MNGWMEKELVVVNGSCCVKLETVYVCLERNLVNVCRWTIWLEY